MSSFSFGMKIWYYAYNKSIKYCLPVDDFIVELIFLHKTCFEGLIQISFDFILLSKDIIQHDIIIIS